MDVEFCFIAMSWILTPYQKDDLHIVSPVLWVDSSLFADKCPLIHKFFYFNTVQFISKKILAKFYALTTIFVII